jgi:ornithine carbamoyltransferase
LFIFIMKAMKEEKRDFLTLKDYTPLEIRQIIDITKDVKQHPEKYSTALKGKELALLFQKTSTRTRVSFEVGIHQMGGHSIYLDWRTTNFTLGDMEDEIRCISRYVDVIMARVYEHKEVVAMANAASIPLINGLSGQYHPCQALADLFTMEERLGDIKKIKAVFIGDGDNNVSHSFIVICAKLGVNLTVVAPKEFSVCADIRQWLTENSFDEYIKITDNIEEGIKGADVLYTDTFVSMGQESESARRLKIFQPYQINSELIKLTGKDPIIMHCLPAHRGFEITSEVLDSSKSVVFDQSENRLHTEKALMIYLLNLSKLKLKIFE